MVGSQKFSDDKDVYSCVWNHFFPNIEGLTFSWWTRPPCPVWAVLSYQMMFLHVSARKSSNVVVCCLFGWAWELVKWSCLAIVARYQGIPPLSIIGISMMKILFQQQIFSGTATWTFPFNFQECTVASKNGVFWPMVFQHSWFQKMVSPTMEGENVHPTWVKTLPLSYPLKRFPNNEV